MAEEQKGFEEPVVKEKTPEVEDKVKEDEKLLKEKIEEYNKDKKFKPIKTDKRYISDDMLNNMSIEELKKLDGQLSKTSITDKPTSGNGNTRDINTLLIAEGIEDNLEAVNVAEIKNHDIILSVPKTEWKAGLENAMEYYIKKEEYEECSKIKNLIEKL